jgi:hypothetical protein
MQGCQGAIMLVLRRVATGVRAVNVVMLMPGATLVCAVLVWCCVASAPQAWSNGGKSTSTSIPKFGTHDYITFQGYKLAGQPNVIKQNLNAFFIGTEAPDFGKALFPSAEGTYADRVDSTK